MACKTYSNYPPKVLLRNTAQFKLFWKRSPVQLTRKPSTEPLFLTELKVMATAQCSSSAADLLLQAFSVLILSGLDGSSFLVSL